mmetsp:Transcript_104225/g.190963  ORF Transcript_104225/g.190963 Transcript_104225/m.190963 type:complete len:92 (-) Transcript_104225:2-277(-)
MMSMEKIKNVRARNATAQKSGIMQAITEISKVRRSQKYSLSASTLIMRMTRITRNDRKIFKLNPDAATEMVQRIRSNQFHNHEFGDVKKKK